MIVSVANVIQNPGSAFTVNGTTLQFTGTPPSGTNNIWVQYQTAVIQVNQPGQGTVGANQMQLGAALANIGVGGLTPSYLSPGAPSWNSSGNLSFNSGYGSAATAYGCRAWVNFNGTGTVAIRASGNVSSITDNGVSLYRVNFTNAMPDTNYSVAGSTVGCTVASYILAVFSNQTALTTGYCNIELRNCVNGSNYDSDVVAVAVFR
jgi:hypothetical protein